MPRGRCAGKDFKKDKTTYLFSNGPPWKALYTPVRKMGDTGYTVMRRNNIPFKFINR